MSKCRHETLGKVTIVITTPINTDEDEHDTDQHTGCPIKISGIFNFTTKANIW